jgi:predicted nucleic acid-binding protein
MGSKNLPGRWLFESITKSLHQINLLPVKKKGGEHQWEILEKVLGDLTRPSGNLFFDVRTATLMHEHGVRETYTTDTDFLQFPGIKDINPLK